MARRHVSEGSRCAIETLRDKRNSAGQRRPPSATCPRLLLQDVMQSDLESARLTHARRVPTRARLEHSSRRGSDRLPFDRKFSKFDEAVLFTVQSDPSPLGHLRLLAKDNDLVSWGEREKCLHDRERAHVVGLDRRVVEDERSGLSCPNKVFRERDPQEEVYLFRSSVRQGRRRTPAPSVAPDLYG